MKIRMTLTAVALGALALSGCNSMGKSDTMMTAPAAPAATVTAPAMTKPAMTAPAVTVTAPSVTVAAPTVTTTTAAAPAAMATDAMAPAVTVAEPAGDAMMKDDSMMVKEDAMMSDDTMMAKADDTMSADDAAMNACFAAGGQVVGWVGDPTGAEQACRREDGLEYRLSDAQYYQ